MAIDGKLRVVRQEYKKENCKTPTHQLISSFIQLIIDLKFDQTKIINYL